MVAFLILSTENLYTYSGHFCLNTACILLSSGLLNPFQKFLHKLQYISRSVYPRLAWLAEEWHPRWFCIWRSASGDLHLPRWSGVGILQHGARYAVVSSDVDSSSVHRCHSIVQHDQGSCARAVRVAHLPNKKKESKNRCFVLTGFFILI